MLFRPIALLAALALIPGCSMPRAGMVAGAVTAIAGAALISDASNMRPSRGAFDVTPLVVSEAEVLVGSSLLVGAAVTLIASLVGLSQEHAAEEERAAARAARTAMSLRAPAAASAAASASSSSAVLAPSAPRPGSARAALNGRVAQLAFELRLEARAGHCATAEALALRLDRLDRAQLIALADDDAAIASCVDVARAP